MPLVATFGPEGLPSALVLTIDNLGEARALERGTQPPEAPVGDDPSVTVALPWLLDELESHRLSATFFVEAINIELYPDALKQIAARGHGLGLHGWRHEEWTSLSAEQERDVLARSVEAFSTLGLEPRGFRPPGGELNSRSPSLLVQAGLRWCSPAGGSPGVRRGLAYLPFTWSFVDAYHLMDSFAPLRTAHGDPEPALDAVELADRWEEELQDLAATGGLRTLVLHPFLMLDERWSTGVTRLLGFMSELARERRTWVVSGDTFVDWLHGSRAALSS
jgi:peptidoglycan/xylan/chitin deacetylase (PgdA/CDA1 family)